MINTRIMVFTKNSPWGVVYDPVKGPQYKHTIAFPDKNKKSEFVDKFLCNKNSKGWRDEFKTVSDTASIEFINEYKFKFTTTPTEQGGRFADLNELSLSDIAMTQYHNKEYYWTLTVVSRTESEITFEATLDIPFTFLSADIFSPEATNFITQAHMNRWTKKGDIDTIIWDNVLKNTLDIQPTIEKKMTITDKSKLHKIDRWAIVHIKSDEASFKNWFEQVSGGNPVKWNDLASLWGHSKSYIEHNVTLPYVSIIIPLSKGYKIFCDTSSHTTKELLDIIIRKSGDNLININIVNDLCLTKSGGKEIFDIVEDYGGFSNWLQIKLRNPDNLYDAVAGSTVTGPWENFDEDNKKYNLVFYFLKDIAEANPKKYLVDKPNIQVDDPILLHPSCFNLKLYTWNTEGKTYFWHQIVQDSKTTNKWDNTLKCINFFSPTNNSSIAWLDLKKEYKESVITNTNYASIPNNTILPYSKNPYQQYMRDNKNQWETRKTFDKTSGISNMILSGVGLVGSIASFNLKGIAASTFGMVSSTISYHRNEAMRKAHVNDMKNQAPSLMIGNDINLNVMISNINKSHKLKLSYYTLPPHIKEMLLDKVKIYGYEVNENKKIKDLLFTRKNFNYIEAVDIFNAITLKVSAPIKQILNQAFLNGITLWHYRNENDFKGVLNYDVENGEV